MLKLFRFITPTLALIGTLNSSLAMDKVAESPKALVRKYMLIREGANNIQIPLEITKLIGITLNQLNKLKLEFSCPSISKIEQEISTYLTPESHLNTHTFEESGTRYSIESYTYANHLGKHPKQIHLPLNFESVLVKKFISARTYQTEIDITCLYSDTSKDKGVIRVSIHPVHNDGSLVDLLNYNIEMIKNVGAPFDVWITKKTDQAEGGLAGYRKNHFPISPSDIKFVLSPQ